MRFSHLTFLVLTLLIFACGEKDITAFDPAVGEWEFSLSNPLPVIKNLKVPSGTPMSSRLRPELIQAGDVLRVEGDTVILENDLQLSFMGSPRKFPLFNTDDHPDSLAGLKLSQGVGTTLKVAYYFGDSLLGDWLFEAKKEDLQEIAFAELDGQTYRCAFPGRDTMQVHFGTTTRLNGQNEGDEMEYFVEELPGFNEEETRLRPNGFGYWGARMGGMRTNSWFISFNPGFYGSKRYRYGRGQDGTVYATYIEVDSGRYEKVNMPLVLLSDLQPSGTAEADFADRMNSGMVLADDTYPHIDSARVEYRYQKDYKGIDYNELSELELSAEPGGEFIVVVRDRLLQNNKWKLSPDGRYLITLGKNGQQYAHYPILAYTDEYIDLRMPFSVKTREPRGVALESFADLDVFIRIARREGATSR